MVRLTIWYTNGTVIETSHYDFDEAYKFMVSEGDHVLDWETNEDLD